jgi:hypothetical protein
MGQTKEGYSREKVRVNIVYHIEKIPRKNNKKKKFPRDSSYQEFFAF